MARSWHFDRPVVQEVGGVGEPVRAVHVVLLGGRVDVVAHAGRSSVRLDVQDVIGRPLGVSLGDGTLRVEQHKEPGSPFLDMVKGFFANGASSARLTLTVPAGVKVTITTVSGDVLVGGVEGDVTVSTVSGAVSLSRLAGRVDVRTVSSAVDAAGLSGELKTKSVSGRLTVDGSTLRSAKLATVSGPLVLDLVGPVGLVTANAVSGDITIHIPGGAGYDVTAASQSGHVVVDGHTLSGGADADKGGHRFEGDRTFAIKARTVSGNVVVLRGESAGVPRVESDALPHLVGRADDVQDARRPSGGSALWPGAEGPGASGGPAGPGSGASGSGSDTGSVERGEGI